MSKTKKKQGLDEEKAKEKDFLRQNILILYPLSIVTQLY